MAKNPGLESAVRNMMARVLLEKDPMFKVICENDVECGVGVIKLNGKMRVDKNCKVRQHFESIIGYGYDLTKKTEDGEPARDMYDNAVKNTREMSGSPHTETFLHEEVQGHFGLYLTKV